jgi:hydroxymethylglutaryl-CoA synthase
VAGLVAYGSYIPHWRLEKASIRTLLGSGGGTGYRSVASFDEDAASMSVEAGRKALVSAPEEFSPDAIYLATANPPYLDKTNASVVHAALGLDESVGAYDFLGAPRSSSGAMRMASSSSMSSLVLSADIRNGLPTSVDEARGGDAAVCFAFAPNGPFLAEVLAHCSSSEEFLDRWRSPGDVASSVWEERFGESVYVPLAQRALTDACKKSDVSLDQIDHLIVSGLHQRAVRSFVTGTGVAKSKIADDLVEQVGNSGTAHPGLLLANVLDTANPGEVIAVVHLADGADVTLYRAGDALVHYRAEPHQSVASQIANGNDSLSYASFLTWRGLLDREPPRRPDPVSPAAPPSYRNEGWKFSLTASRCTVCGTRHVPSGRVCMNCHAVDRMVPERLVDAKGTIATYTVDWLAYSLSPPVIVVVVDFDRGGRFVCEMADAHPDELEIGARVAMTFRRLYTSRTGVHNYFWKARLISEDDS